MGEIDSLRNRDPRAQRRPSGPATLGTQTIRWMAELPQQLRPTELASRFPHIANKLAAMWSSPVNCRTYFDDVLLDRRGNRRGLPERAAMELAALKNHFDSVVFPTHQTVWEEIASRARA